MISIHKITTVGIYEMKTLLRSWFFRIFAGLSILIIGIFNIAANITNSGAPFIYRALPAALPYVNLLLLNVGQAIVAVFLASEFLKQDRKNDTVEVIYARSMTNGEYILGKTLGILLVFLILNIIILSLGIGFSFLSSDSSKGILEYFFYPLLISLPTLVYILGLSFFLMIISKNQAVTFIILLGYIAVSIFYLDKQYYQVFDFIAYQIPMIKSTIGGFADLNTTIIHRGIYFFIGLGLIFFTITRLDRLPQSKFLRRLPLSLSIVFISIGALLAYSYLSSKKEIVETKKSMIQLNNKYSDYPFVTVDSCILNLLHDGTKIEVSSQLVITNPGNKPVDTLIFSLNPGLKISSVSIKQSDLSFDHEMQILKIFLTIPLAPDETTILGIDYGGRIDESVCFLDQNLENYKDNFSFEIFRLKKRYAYVEKDFVLLTDDALWYPVSGVGYASDNPSLHASQFANYKLNVKTSPDLVAISQGDVSNSQPGNYKFTNNHPLPKISLLIGEYINYSIEVDSVMYSIYTKKENDYYKEYFTEVIDSLPGIIRELKNEYESQINFTYPFKKFSLAEVPVQFSLDKHIWSISSDAVQPEITFYSEKGVVLEETDFKKRKQRTERRMNRNKEEVTPAELQSRIFKRFVRGNFMAPYSEWYMFDGMDRNTLTLFPNYFTFVTSLNSDRWPALNLSLQAYLKDRYSNPVSSNRWFFTDLSNDEKINLELRESSLANFSKTYSADSEDDDDISIYDLILAKGDYLFSVFRARYGDKQFNSLLDSVVKLNYGRAFTVQELDSAMQNQNGGSIINEIDNWYYGQSLPGFIIKDLNTYKIRDDEYTKYQIRFKISNPEPADGIVTINIDLYDPNNKNRSNDEPPDFSRKIHIPGGTAKEVGFVFATEPERMNIYTHISKNLPNNLIYDFGSFNEMKKVEPIDDVVECELFSNIVEKGVYITDNEDSLFSFTDNNKISYLKRLVDSKKEKGYPYSGIRFWNPPSDWRQVLRSGFYGKYVRSAYYTRSGSEDQWASWKANITDSAYYDVYYHVEKINVSRRRETKKSDYNFKVFHEGGVENINLTDGDLENGWNYLGTYFITPETAMVELSNKSVGPMIFADAVKWVKN